MNFDNAGDGCPPYRNTSLGLCIGISTYRLSLWSFVRFVRFVGLPVFEIVYFWFVCSAISLSFSTLLNKSFCRFQHIRFIFRNGGRPSYWVYLQVQFLVSFISLKYEYKQKTLKFEQI